jgi:hypothetical protein
VAELTREQKIRKIELLKERNRRYPVRPRPENKPQTLAISTYADWLFYGGAAGGGKTYLIIILALTQHKRSCIYRRTYKQGLQIRDTLHRIVTAAGGASRHDKTEFELNGRLVHFRSLDHWDAVEGLQGNEYDLMAFDECTQFPQIWIDYLSTWNRSPDKAQRCRMVLTSNPPTSSDGAWVKLAFAKWIDDRHPNPAKSGEMAYFVNVEGRLIECPNGEPVEIDGQIRHPHTRIFIQANALDNPDLGERYYNKLDSLPEALRRAFKYGDWKVMDMDGANQFFPSAWVEAAVDRGRTMPDGLPIRSIGCDVATVGDESAQAYYDGNRIVEIVAVKGLLTSDGHGYNAWLKASIIERLLPFIPKIGIDPIFGSAFDICKEDPFYQGNVQPIHFGEAANAMSDNGMLDLPIVKVALYWYLRTRLDPDGENPMGIPDDPALIAQFKAINYRVDGRKVVLEKKSDMKERVGFSPDRLESCIYAIAHEILRGADPLAAMYG